MTSQQRQPDISESRQPSLYSAAIITLVLATAAVALRFTARRLTHLDLWYDDGLIVVAWLGATAFFIDSLVWMQLGLGVHYQTLTMNYDLIVRHTLMNLFVEEIFYSTATVFMKLSLLALYSRIFKLVSIKWPIRILAIAVVSWLVARYIAIILHCIPVAAYWDNSIKTATCGVNDRLFFMGTNTVNTILDICIFILPLHHIQKLQVQRNQKLVVSAMFTLGGFVIGVSVALLVVCYRVDNESAVVTWTISPIVIWAGTEINLGVVSACLPCLRPIYDLIAKGSATPGATKNLHQFEDTYALRKRAIATFSFKGRNIKSFSRINAEEEDPNGVYKESRSEDTANHSPSINNVKEPRPPLDKVMVREDICVEYTDL